MYEVTTRENRKEEHQGQEEMMLSGCGYSLYREYERIVDQNQTLCTHN